MTRETDHRAYGGEDHLHSTGHKLFISAANEQQVTEKVALLVCLIQAMGLPRDASLLDAGCGQGFTTRYLEQAGFDCFGVDVSPTAIETARQAGTGQYAVAALHEMRLGRCFDIVLCTDVLYHVVDDVLWERTLGALAGHLDGDGVLLVVEAFSDVPSASPHARWRILPRYSEAFERLDLCIAASEAFTESVTGQSKTILIVCRKGRAERYTEAVRGARIEVLRAAFARRTAHQEAQAAALVEAAEAQRAGQARLDEARATIAFFKAEVRKEGVRAEQSKAKAAAAERRLQALQRSQSYRLGHALVRAAKLPATLLRGPDRTGTPMTKADEDAPFSFAARIEAVAARDDVARAEVLLYAYIDLNVAGGSSSWLSSMASMLARYRRVILVARRNITTDVVVTAIENHERVTILEPRHFDHRRTHFKVKEAIEIVRGLDAACPGLTSVFVRGTDAVAMLLADRQFHARTYAYLTDFYEIGEDGIRVPADRARQLGVIAIHARRILVQTDLIAERIREVTGADFESLDLPPPVADDLPIRVPRPVTHQRICIGYAGKIAPDWGIRELLDWTKTLRADSFDVQLTIVGDKISGPRTPELNLAFRDEIIRRMHEVGVIRSEQLARAEAIGRMQEMDFVWCWRPASLEHVTLELSTKLVEGVASGSACICFPSETNRRLLGEDYPYFVESLEDLRRLLREDRPVVPAAAVVACRERHSFATLSARLESALPAGQSKPAPRICFAGHDFKFIDPYISRLKLDGWPVTRDVWKWGEPENPEISRARLAAADIVFCEWGLGNAVWYSRNLLPGKRLFVRVHLQEINERARNLARQILPDSVDRFIFVSEWVRDEAVLLFGWPREKTLVIPNFALDEEYVFRDRSFNGPIRLGMVGIIPWSKRIDRAIDLLEALQRAGHAAELHIKGPRPETTGFMYAKGRRGELDAYEAQYNRVWQDPRLDRAVSFHPSGNDVAAFYRVVDHILSPSDLESFHYPVADGVLSGCHPVVWPWRGAAATYDPGWIVESTDAAVDRIVAFRGQSAIARSDALAQNRALVCNRYGTAHVYGSLTGVLLNEKSPNPEI